MLQKLLFSALAGIVGWAQVETSPPPATWILQIEGDAAALEVTGASRKPFAWRAPRGLVSTYRVTLIGADGATLGSAPLDLSDFCLKPAHRGTPAHVHGDRIVAHEVCLTAKVPVHDDVVELRIVQLRTGQEPRVLGTIDRQALVELVKADDEQPRGTEPPQEGGSPGSQRRGEKPLEEPTAKPNSGTPEQGAPRKPASTETGEVRR